MEELSLDNQIEAILFWRGEPQSIKKLAENLGKKEEEILAGVKDLTGLEGKAEAGKVKLLTSCPACQQGLNRYADTTGVDTDYIVVEMAANWLGANWQEDFIQRIQNGGVEKVLL